MKAVQAGQDRIVIAYRGCIEVWNISIKMLGVSHIDGYRFASLKNLDF